MGVSGSCGWRTWTLLLGSWQGTRRTASTVRGFARRRRRTRSSSPSERREGSSCFSITSRFARPKDLFFFFNNLLFPLIHSKILLVYHYMSCTWYLVCRVFFERLWGACSIVWHFVFAHRYGPVGSNFGGLRSAMGTRLFVCFFLLMLCLVWFGLGWVCLVGCGSIGFFSQRRDRPFRVTNSLRYGSVTNDLCYRTPPPLHPFRDVRWLYCSFIIVVVFLFYRRFATC